MLSNVKFQQNVCGKRERGVSKLLQVNTIVELKVHLKIRQTYGLEFFIVLMRSFEDYLQTTVTSGKKQLSRGDIICCV